MPSLLILLLAGCPSSATSRFDQCTLDVTLSVTEALAGDTITLTGGPQSERYDTTVRVADLDADVLSVTRIGCDACDACVPLSCESACESCAACASACATCVEMTTALVPDLAAGDADVVMLNRFGQSPVLPLTIAAANPATGANRAASE